jgi:PAS domain S-box-containing protein
MGESLNISKAPSSGLAPDGAEIRSHHETCFELLAEQACDVMVRADLAGMVTYVSRACRAYGYEPEELIGQPADALVHPDDLERFRASMAEIFSDRPIDRSADREIRYRCKDGSWVWLEGNPQAIHDATGRPVELLNVFRDVTERRRLRDGQAEQLRFEKLANAVAGVGYWRLDVRTQKISWSEQMFAMYGLEPASEPQLGPAMAMIHPEDRAKSNDRLCLAIETGDGWTDGMTRIVRPNGEVRYVEGRGICEKDEAGVVRGVIGTMVDVTDRKRAEFAAQKAEAERKANAELFENAFQYAAGGMALVGLDGRFLKINPAFCELLGYAEPELLVLDFQTITHPDDLEADL